MKRTQLRRQSPQKALWNSRYARAKAKRMLEHPGCEVCEFTRRLIRPAQDGHHPFGQGGKRIMVFVVACRVCHDVIHGNPNAARTAGWLYRRGDNLIQPVRDAIERAGMSDILP